MLCPEFIESTICKMDTQAFDLVKDKLISKYLSFSIIKPSEIRQDILAEKLCDHFYVTEVKTGRSFDKQIESFMNDLDIITSPRISKPSQPKKDEKNSVCVPRARKYYDKALSYKNRKNISLRQLLDYVRIMMCLYTSSMNNEDRIIDNFILSSSCLDLDRILEHMEKEEISIIFPPSRRKRFDSKDKYSAESCTLIMTIITIGCIIDERFQGEHNHE